MTEKTRKRKYTFKVSGVADKIEINAYNLHRALSKLGLKMEKYILILKQKKIKITLEKVEPDGDEEDTR